MIFTQKRTTELKVLKMYEQDIEWVKNIRFLGIWFDGKVIWNNHIQKIIDKCKNILNIMRCLAGKEWGADRTALKKIYTAMIRSNIDYGSIIYASAAKTHLEKLDNIQHQALRICTGAIRTTPTAALKVEMGEPSLELRRTQLAINYWINLKGNNPDHPTLDIIKPCWEKEKKKNRSFGWVIEKKVEEIQLLNISISPVVPLPTIPPWILPNAKVDFTIMKKKNDKGFNCNSYTVQKYIDQYYSYVQIYTDASKDSTGKIGIAIIIPEFHIKQAKRITNGLSVYTGEMSAILLAVQWVEEVRPLRSLICSDSSSALLSLQNSHSESRPDILLEIQQTLF
ncbi:uncharacterized protein LOC106528677, partial [Austrofundulus limnaeus]|uniref:Uncharacterized protein LOC106528677 n=1 Tax=Austrofundulus limnaeus TaxID=52670 RepID=A0A2I4CH95_AUSLI